WALLVVALGAAAFGGKVLATNPTGVTTTTFGVGRFDDIDSTTKTDIDRNAATDERMGHHASWQARIKTKGAADLSGRIGLRGQRPRHARRPERGQRRPRDRRGLPCSGGVPEADRRAGSR